MRIPLAPLALLVLVTLARVAGAQAPGGRGVAIDVFLEQRVAEELAADGTILSRLGVALDIEAVGDRLIVSLVDPATRRAVASTKVDSIPADREAAVAQVTKIVAGLTTQVASNASPTAAAVREVLRDERRDRETRETAEYKFRQEAISFGDVLAVTTTGKTTTVTSSRVPMQGDMRRHLGGAEFFRVVGRPDLAASYSRRRTAGWIGLLGGTAFITAGGAVFLWGVLGETTNTCDTSDPRFPDCLFDEDPSAKNKQYLGLGLMAGGTIGMLIGVWYATHASPVGESEIYDLAAKHNERLRIKYGLPVSARAPRERRDVIVAPYALDGGGGLTVSGRF